MNLFQKLFLIGGLLFTGLSYAQTNTTCEDMLPFCADTNITFTATSNGPSAQAGNNYDCLGSQPNPSWYYLSIDTAGTINMTLSAPSDIDFIIYGPFSNLADATNGCGNMGNGGTGANVVDCSYSATNNETPSIPNAQVGEFYVVLITNYANSVQQVTLTQNNAGQPGAGSTDCGVLSTPPCSSDPGTFVQLKNNTPTALDLYLCEGESFSIVSNQDYILPNDSIAAPIGDGIYSAQLMWLVYDQPPVMVNGAVSDPNSDPGFMGVNNIIPSDNLNGSNTASDPLLNALGGCGTYYFVPVAGDDGVGGNNNVANGTNDNGGLHWDKDGNGCYLFGDPIEVTFACPIQTTPTTNCTTLANGVDITITGGSGNYTVINTGAGNLVSSNVPNGGTAQIQNLTNAQNWAISITDNAGCTATESGVFSAPTIADTTFIPAPTCNGGSGTGSVEVILGNTGQAPFTVNMNGTPTPNPYIFTGTAGTGVNVLITDNNGCTYNDLFTITSSDHYIIVTVDSIHGEQCAGDGQGYAEISATPVDANGNPDGTPLTSIIWMDPTNVQVGSNAVTHLSESNMMPGMWNVTVSDQIGCSVTVGIEITTPPDLNILTSNQKDPTCYNGIDGDIEVLANGGVPFTSSPQYLFTWDSNNPQTPIGPTHVANAPAGDYWVFVEDAAGCIDSLLITLNNPPEIEAFFTIKPIICHGESTGSIIIDSVHYAAANYTFNWNIDFDNNNIPDIPNTSNIANNLPAGSYEVTIVDANNCAKPYTNIIVPQADSLYVSNLSVFQEAICVNPPISTDGYGQISFDPQGGLLAGATNNEGTDYYGQQNTTFLIYESTGDTIYLSNGTKGHLNGGDYTVHLLNEYGCKASPATITLPTLSPNAAFTAVSNEFTSDYVGTAPVEVTFTNVSSNYDFANDSSYNTTGPYDIDTLFTWFFVDLNGDTAVYNTESLAPIVKNYTEEGLYYVCLEVEENLNHCIDSTCIEIQIFDAPQLVAPNIFTPEGDGINDYFFFPNSAIVEFQAVVLDRWGKKVFEFNDIDTKWDGTNITNGKPCTDGVYFYTYEGQSSNGTKYKGQGNVQLLRKK